MNSKDNKSMLSTGIVANDYFRIDKNIAHNIDKIAAMIDPNDNALIKSLIYYFSYTYKSNFFHFGRLDPEKFAKDFGMTASYLRMPHKKPAQLADMSEDEKAIYYQEQAAHPDDPSYRIWDSVLENALYVLSTKPLTLTRGGWTYAEGKRKSIQSIQIIKEVSAVYIPRKDRRLKKVIYEFVLNEEFITNLTSYFLPSYKQALIDLRKSGLDNLYLYLSNLRDTLYAQGKHKTTIEATPNFSLLCDLAGIRQIKKDGNPYEPKYRKRDLIKALEKIKERSQLQFQFTPVKGVNEKFPFTFIFEFEKVKAESLKKEFEQEKISILHENILRELVAIFRAININTSHLYSEEEFYKWLTSDINKEEKITAYRNAQIKTFRVLPQFINQIQEGFYKKLIQSECKNKEDFFKLCE